LLDSLLQETVPRNKVIAMGDIKDEMGMDYYEEEEWGKSNNGDYEDYKDIVIEVDEKILKFISSFKIGSMLSLEVLVALADKYECVKYECGALFYSKTLFEEHEGNHSPNNPVDIANLHSPENINEEEEELQDGFKTDCDDQEDNTAEPDEEEENIEEDIKFDVNLAEDSKEQKLPLPFSCNICDKPFLRESWLVRHRFSHPELIQEAYSCFHCKNIYQGKFAKSSYKKHIDRLITREERICETCGHIARTVEYLEIHKQVKHLGLKRFKCDIEECEKEFSKNRYLIIHRRTHNSSTTYYCEYTSCDYTSNLKKNIARHKVRRHVDGSINLNCDKCKYVAPNKDRLQTHTRNYHSGILNECNHCDKKYRDRSKYLLHLRRDHQGVRYKCENCDLEFTHKHTLVTHIKRDHEGLKLKCEKCDHEATSQRALRFHVVKSHEKNPFACDTCSFVGSNYPFLYSHRNKIHNGVKYHCDLCGHVSYNETLLKYHMKQKHPDQEPTIYDHQKTTFDVEDHPKCEPCNKLFQTPGRYLSHKQKIHINTSATLALTQASAEVEKVESKEVKKKRGPKKKERLGPLVNRKGKPIKLCPTKTCEKKFTAEKRLQRHILLNHTSVMPCEECGRTFTEKRIFINHQKWHRYDTATSCEVCGKELTRSNLIKHFKMYHSDSPPEKRHFCDVCGKDFFIESQLLLHMKHHYNQKDFICTFDGCDKAFYVKSHRQDHERVHTGQSIRQCLTCSKEFKSMSAYRYHINRIHPQLKNSDMSSSTSSTFSNSNNSL